VTSRTEMQVLSVGIALLQGQHFTNTALLLAAANMATIPVLVLFLFFQRQLVQGITLSGLK
jgi:multiple sugar transport system permease protein